MPIDQKNYDPALIVMRIMRQRAVKDGLLPGDYTCKDILGFDPYEVATVHTHKIGHGDGVFFRLKDGRVVNAGGEEEDSNPALYDTVEN